VNVKVTPDGRSLKVTSLTAAAATVSGITVLIIIIVLEGVLAVVQQSFLRDRRQYGRRSATSIRLTRFTRTGVMTP